MVTLTGINGALKNRELYDLYLVEKTLLSMPADTKTEEVQEWRIRNRQTSGLRAQLLAIGVKTLFRVVRTTAHRRPCIHRKVVGLSAGFYVVKTKRKHQLQTYGIYLGH